MDALVLAGEPKAHLGLVGPVGMVTAPEREGACAVEEVIDTDPRGKIACDVKKRSAPTFKRLFLSVGALPRSTSSRSVLEPHQGISVDTPRRG
jgi:hypothetical protein